MFELRAAAGPGAALSDQPTDEKTAGAGGVSMAAYDVEDYDDPEEDDDDDDDDEDADEDDVDYDDDEED